MKRSNFILLALVLLLLILPLILPLPSDLKVPFSGTDNQSQAMIVAAHPDYQPWFEPLWKPPSSEIEGLLFALQAALGSGLLGYYLGLRRGQSQARQQTRDRIDAGD